MQVRNNRSDMRKTPSAWFAANLDIKAQARAKPWIISLALVLIAFSAACRLYHLNEKLFWFDEEGAAILVAPKYKIGREWTGRPMVPAEWRKLEQVDKSAPITQVLDNLRSKSIPDQAPFYYLAARVWTQICGDNPGDFRLVSVVFSFLALPLVFALAMELFNSRTVSWLSLAIFSVSRSIWFMLKKRDHTRCGSVPRCCSGSLWLRRIDCKRRRSGSCSVCAMQ